MLKINKNLHKSKNLKENTFLPCVVSLIILLFVKNSQQEYIDELEYNKMPKLFTMENFDDCLLQPQGLYCMVDIQLNSKKKSDLWYQIKNFSANTLKHYKHDILHKGICVTGECKSIANYSSVENIEHNKFDILDKCINWRLEKEYDLQGNITIQYCEHRESRMKYDIADWIFLLVIGSIILFNIISTTYHIRLTRMKKKADNMLLISFSVIENWKKLMKTEKTTAHPNERTSLRCIQGMRFLTMMAVIFSHVVLIIPYGYVSNTLKIELTYNDPLMQFLYNGTAVVQTFFCISSFLVSYNFLLYIEKKEEPKILLYIAVVVQRWIRLTPIYALTMGFVATFYGKMGFGPQWRHVVLSEVEACRSYWWANLLYINNYIPEAHFCMPQTWYLATDTQLFYYGMVVMMILWTFPKLKSIIFGILLIIAIFIPGVITYIKKYNPVVLQSPEDFRNLYENNETFLKIYSTVEGNISGYTIGLICGCIMYHLKQNNISLKDKQIFKVLYYATFPLGISIILSGAVFYTEYYSYNPLISAVYAASYKTIFTILIGSFIIGSIQKCGSLYNKVIEWKGFHILGRLTYSAYLLHTIPQRAFIGLIKQPFDIVELNVLFVFAASVVITYVISWPLCILIEIPFGNIQKLLFQRRKTSSENFNKESNIDIYFINKVDDSTNITSINSKL